MIIARRSNVANRCKIVTFENLKFNNCYKNCVCIEYVKLLTAKNIGLEYKMASVGSV